MFQILVVDDTKSVQAFVKDLLRKVPEISTQSVYNGAEAIKLLEQKNKFDLILLDWEMPVLNGPETFQKIKELAITTPTIMMTTKNLPEEISQMLNMGVAEYLMKPFTFDILLEKIEFVSGRFFSHAA